MENDISSFSIAFQYPSLDHFTLSSVPFSGMDLIVFSLAESTEISQEKYADAKLYMVQQGSGAFHADERKIKVKKDEAIIIPADTFFGVSTEDEQGMIYTESVIGKEYYMNELIKAGEVFKLKDLVPYQSNTIVNADIIKNDKMKLALMAFDEGTGLTPHKAPGEAIVFALEGKAKIGYEGKEYTLEAGQQFHFAKGGEHSVAAEGRFKMALLIAF